LDEDEIEEIMSQATFEIIGGVPEVKTAYYDLKFIGPP
jgi:hypothetical protein